MHHHAVCACSALLQVQPARPSRPRLPEWAGLCPAPGPSLPAMWAPGLPCCPGTGLCQVPLLLWRVHRALDILPMLLVMLALQHGRIRLLALYCFRGKDQHINLRIFHTIATGMR